jgi:hypothetical protein
VAGVGRHIQKQERNSTEGEAIHKTIQNRNKKKHKKSSVKHMSSNYKITERSK